MGIPYCVLASDAYRHLGLWGRAILVEITREMNGYNNGAIVLSQRQIAKRLNTSNFKKIGQAIAELMEHGLIDICAEGKWKERRAREYRLTFVSTGKMVGFKPATNEYLGWTTLAISSVEPVSAATLDSDEGVSAARILPAKAVSSPSYAKLRKRPKLTADTVSPHINSHT